MISKEQYIINKAYNEFLFQLVLWKYLYNKVKADREQGYDPVKNYNKMLGYQEFVENMLPEIKNFDRSKIRSYYPLIDDIELIKKFKEIVG
jgi:predicted transcriptional regulator